MLQDTQSIRYYQRLTDDMVDLWHRGSRFDEIRLYVEGYLACLRDSNSIEPYLIHRLEEEIFRFLRDPSNFEYLSPQTQTQTEADYGYYWPLLLPHLHKQFKCADSWSGQLGIFTRELLSLTGTRLGHL